MDKHIYFVRHGQTDSNIDGIFRGRNAMLTDEGRTQATIVAKRIKHLAPEALLASDFPRAQETAAIISAEIGLSVEINPLWGEWREPSSFDGRHREESEILRAHNSILSNTSDNPYNRHHNEESFHEIIERAYEAIAFLEAHSTERICVVTHGGFLRALIGTLVFEKDFAKRIFVSLIHKLSMKNTGITYVRKISDKWRLITWNDHTHFG